MEMIYSLLSREEDTLSFYDVKVVDVLKTKTMEAR